MMNTNIHRLRYRNYIYNVFLMHYTDLSDFHSCSWQITDLLVYIELRCIIQIKYQNGCWKLNFKFVEMIFLTPIENPSHKRLIVHFVLHDYMTRRFYLLLFRLLTCSLSGYSIRMIKYMFSPCNTLGGSCIKQQVILFSSNTSLCSLDPIIKHFFLCFMYKQSVLVAIHQSKILSDWLAQMSLGL